MKMRQLFLKLELFEYDTEDFPTPILPKVLYKSHKMFFNEDVQPALLATKFLISRIGLNEMPQL